MFRSFRHDLKCLMILAGVVNFSKWWYVFLIYNTCLMILAGVVNFSKWWYVFLIYNTYFLKHLNALKLTHLFRSASKAKVSENLNHLYFATYWNDELLNCIHNLQSRIRSLIKKEIKILCKSLQMTLYTLKFNIAVNYLIKCAFLCQQ